MGNSVWRLETSLNYLARRVRELGKTEDIEVIVTDWSSEIPLSAVVNLNEDAQRITSFIHVPADVAMPLQKDSPFPEVLALNAAVRRATGTHIGRIDQDTLVGRRFLKAFFDWYEMAQVPKFDLERSLLFANRREIPLRFTSSSPSIDNIERFVKSYKSLLPFRKAKDRPFWSYEVGIWLLHRALWHECRGYNEDLIYFNWMETEMLRRLNLKYPIVNLGEIVDYDFYHLGHYSRFAPPRPGFPKRRRNPVVDFSEPAKSVKANDEDWGLRDFELEIVGARNSQSHSSSAARSFSSWLVSATAKETWDRTRHSIKATGRSARKLLNSTNSQSRLARQVKRAKEMRAASGFSYTDTPNVSLILLSFNHRQNVAQIVGRLRATTAQELIICEDGSVDGAREEWLRLLDRPNEFVICSNDLHEIRVHNRAISMATADIVCILQDDDIPPVNGDWITNALKLFETYPKLAILGGHHGYALDLDPAFAKPKARWVFGYRDNHDWKHVQEIPTADPETKIPFMFVEGASVGPVFHRRHAFHELGGFDLNYGQPGEPGTLAEHAICLKAWLNGWQVGIFDPPQFEKYVGGQGTKLFSGDSRRKNEADNLVRIRETYGRRIELVDELVSQQNRQLIRLS
jgi:hypothetical protein